MWRICPRATARTARPARSISDVRDYFITKLGTGSGNAGYNTASVAINQLALSRTDGGEIVIDPAKQLRNAPGSEAVGHAGLPHYTAATITFAAAKPTDAEVWSVTLNGVPYSVTVTKDASGKLPSQRKVLSDLANKIETASGNKYAVAPLTSTTTNSDGVPVTNYKMTIGLGTSPDRWFSGFSVGAAAGGGTVRAIFDIDHAGVVSNSVFTATPYLELRAPDTQHRFVVPGNTEPQDFYRQDKTTASNWDLGSLSYYDPFIEVDFTKAGTYTITVGSFIDYVDNTYFVDEPGAGVYEGTSYDLNVSLQRHGINKDAIVLVGKQVTVVDGTGIGTGAGTGNEVTILGYDAETNTYTLDRLLGERPDDTTTRLDNTSVLEFSYRMQDEFPEYANHPQGSAYDVVLTKDPGADVYVNVTPKPTRTYNADLAFDAAANYGQNKAVQVEVSTPRTVIELTGSARTNDTWVITIDGFDAAQYKWLGIETLVDGQTAIDYIAGQLKTALEAWFVLPGNGTNYQDMRVAIDGPTLTIESYAQAAANSRPATSFNAGFYIDPNSRGSATFLTTQVVELTGVVNAGDLWSIVLDGGTPLTFEHQAASGEDLAAVARTLQIKIGSSSDYTATVRNRRLTITRVNGAEFTLVATPGADGKAIVDASTQVKLSGEVTIGETWTLTLDDTPSVPPISHQVAFGDDLASVAESLRQKIAGAYRATVVGRVITIERLVGEAPIKAAVEIDHESTGGASIKAQLKFTRNNWSTPQSVGVKAIDDAVRDGSDAQVVASLDRERVNLIRGPITIDGGIHVTAESFLDNPLTLPGENNFLLADGTLTGSDTDSASTVATITDARATYVDPVRGVMSGFDPRINDFTYAFTLFEADTRRTIDEKLSDSLTGTSITVKIEDEAASFSTSATGTVTGTGVAAATYASANIALDGFVSAGQQWKVTLNSHDYTYTAMTTDLTLFAVAEGLAEKIKADFATTRSVGKSIEISGGTSTDANFTVELTEGAGRITGTQVNADASWKMVEIPFTALTVAEPNYSITLTNGTANQVYTYVRSAGDSELDVLKGLAKLIDEDRADTTASSTHTERYHAAVKYDTVLLNTSWDPALSTSGALIDHGYFFTPLNPNVTVNEDTQVDVLNVFNGNSPSDDSGFLTTDRLYGLGMGGDTVIGGKAITGGVTYENLESLNIELGSGNDTFTVYSTHSGATTLSTGAGNDYIIVETLAGHMTVDAGAGADKVNVGGSRKTVDEIAARLTVFGGADDEANDDAVQLTGPADVGQVWGLRLVEATTTVASATYTWNGTESLAQGQSRLNYVAQILADDLGSNASGYTFAASSDGTVTVTGSPADAVFKLTGFDVLYVNDSLDTNANSAVLTATALTGLDMPSLAEMQVISVRAASGQFTLGVANGDVTVDGVTVPVGGSTVLDYGVTRRSSKCSSKVCSAFSTASVSTRTTTPTRSRTAATLRGRTCRNCSGNRAAERPIRCSRRRKRQSRSELRPPDRAA